jgi:hypothetical protein
MPMTVRQLIKHLGYSVDSNPGRGSFAFCSIGRIQYDPRNGEMVRDAIGCTLKEAKECILWHELGHMELSGLGMPHMDESYAWKLAAHLADQYDIAVPKCFWKVVRHQLLNWVHDDPYNEESIEEIFGQGVGDEV